MIVVPLPKSSAEASFASFAARSAAFSTNRFALSSDFMEAKIAEKKCFAATSETVRVNPISNPSRVPSDRVP